ncbi:MAG: hypothetical protein RIS83_2215 [Pseudomonadota bacterium]
MNDLPASVATNAAPPSARAAAMRGGRTENREFSQHLQDAVQDGAPLTETCQQAAVENGTLSTAKEAQPKPAEAFGAAMAALAADAPEAEQALVLTPAINPEINQLPPPLPLADLGTAMPTAAPTTARTPAEASSQPIIDLTNGALLAGQMAQPNPSQIALPEHGMPTADGAIVAGAAGMHLRETTRPLGTPATTLTPPARQVLADDAATNLAAKPNTPGSAQDPQGVTSYDAVAPSGTASPNPPQPNGPPPANMAAPLALATATTPSPDANLLQAITLAHPPQQHTKPANGAGAAPSIRTSSPMAKVDAAAAASAKERGTAMMTEHANALLHISPQNAADVTASPHDVKLLAALPSAEAQRDAPRQPGLANNDGQALPGLDTLPQPQMAWRMEALSIAANTREAAPSAPAHQVMPAVVSLALRGDDNALTVALNPVELGKVEISIAQTKEAAEVRIIAERPETLALLQRDARELDRALQQAGLGDMARSLSFSLASQEGRREQGGAWQGHAAGRTTAPSDDAPKHQNTALPLPALRASTSLLDIAI